MKAERPRLGGRPDMAAVRAGADFLLGMLRTACLAIVERFEHDPGYGWLDTKFDLTTGLDFPTDDRQRGKATVYAWVQGRGLEALAEHLRFFIAQGLIKPASAEAERFRRVLASVAGSLCRAREAGAGHLFFSLDTAGRPWQMDDSGNWRQRPVRPGEPFNLSDIFCSRGLYAAARMLGERGLELAAREYCLETWRAVMNGNYQSDQQSFDPKNQVQNVPGRFSHAPFMLLIPSLRLLLREEAQTAHIDAGLKCIAHILERHVAAGEFVEFVDGDGQAWTNRGVMPADPGHALEFIGLSLQFCDQAGQSGLADPDRTAEIARVRAGMPGLFLRCFEYGFDQRLRGIIKLYDLAARTTLNADMPWWSLPETMRAALECHALEPDASTQLRLLEAYAACQNALLGGYLREDVHMMCVQMRDGQGRVSAAIPAVPDADPGYHTGLAIMRCIELMSSR
jgi:hypothetical protein